MANSNTTYLNLIKPEVGADTNAWGGHINDDLDALDAILGGVTAVNLNTVGKNLNVTAGTTYLKDATDATKIAKFSAASISTGTTRTFTLPDVTDTLVTLTATQTLANKSLTAGTTFIKDGTDATKVAQFNAASITTATTRTFTLPDATGTVVLADATQTLTNKSLTAGSTYIKDGTDATKIGQFSAASITTATSGTVLCPDVLSDLRLGQWVKRCFWYTVSWHILSFYVIYTKIYISDTCIFVIHAICVVWFFSARSRKSSSSFFMQNPSPS